MDRRRHSTIIKIFLFIFSLNFISLYLYFSTNPKTSTQKNSVPENRPNLTENHHFQLLGRPNSWPVLPSYLPWNHNPKVSFRSCEAYFGNGFTRRLDVLSAFSSPKKGWFRCFYSETLRSSICEGGRLRMVPEKIKMSMGGERLEEVLGRTEDEEMPEYMDGAFEIDGGKLGSRKGMKLVSDEFLNQYVSEGGVSDHRMRALIGSIRVIGASEFVCEEWVEEPTILLTRFEYANLFHTVTDWYNAYVSSRVTGLPSRPHVVFVDGHCKASMEQMWNALFSSVRYAKHFKAPVCFRHAILSPLGYENALFKGLSQSIDCSGTSSLDLWKHPDDQKTSRLDEFGELVRASFGFPIDRDTIQKTASSHDVLFVRREDYLAHPRHGGKVESRLSNEQEVFDSLEIWTSKNSKCKINLRNGLFAHMSMKEQIQAIQDASVIIGAHGAGLTHIISATHQTVILEIISTQYRRPHFQLISKWKGLEYHPIYLHGSYATPSVVINELANIMKSLGC